MRIIQLSRNEETLVSDEDFDWVNEYKWYCSDTGYAMRSIKYPRKNLRLHREIAIKMGLDMSNQIDHINRNRLDNRRENLRSATNQENHFNLSLSKRNTSGFRGVSWHKASQKWHAQIRIGDKRHHIGLFASKEEAALAYDSAAKLYCGIFANLNSIEIL